MTNFADKATDYFLSEVEFEQNLELLGFEFDQLKTDWYDRSVSFMCVNREPSKEVLNFVKSEGFDWLYLVDEDTCRTYKKYYLKEM